MDQHNIDLIDQHHLAQTLNKAQTNYIKDCRNIVRFMSPYSMDKFMKLHFALIDLATGRVSNDQDVNKRRKRDIKIVKIYLKNESSTVLPNQALLQFVWNAMNEPQPPTPRRLSEIIYGDVWHTFIPHLIRMQYANGHTWFQYEFERRPTKVQANKLCCITSAFVSNTAHVPWHRGFSWSAQ